jgi:hypothetical protein
LLPLKKGKVLQRGDKALRISGFPGNGLGAVREDRHLFGVRVAACGERGEEAPKRRFGVALVFEGLGNVQSVAETPLRPLGVAAIERELAQAAVHERLAAPLAEPLRGAERAKVVPLRAPRAAPRGV